MNNRLVAKTLLNYPQKDIPRPYARENPEFPTRLPHLRWMLLKIKEGGMSEGKTGRWLGWVQACLHQLGYFTLDELKELNRQASCDDLRCDKYGELHVHE